MSHWKKMMDPKEMLFAYDLEGRDIALTIDKVVGGELIGELGKKSKKPIASFKETPKKLALNTTNCKTIAQLYGSNETNDWAGKRIQLFPTQTQFGGQSMDCIRIRPTIPPPAKSSDKKLRDETAPSSEMSEADRRAIAAAEAAENR